MLDPGIERKIAVSLYNSCWALMEKIDRTPEEDAEMVHQAHSSRWHWGNIGGLEERAMGEWQCARVHSILGDGHAALRHATLSAALADELTSPHFMKSSAAEGLAFAYLVLGDRDKADFFKMKAISLLEGLDEEDAAHIRRQIEELPFQ